MNLTEMFVNNQPGQSALSFQLSENTQMNEASKLQPAAKVFAPSQQHLPQVWSKGNAQVTNIIKELQAQSVNLEMFSCNPMDYPFFITNV